MLVVTTPAASSRLATLAAAKAALGVTGTAEDATIGDLIDRASSVIAGHCRRVMGRQTYTETVYLSSPQRWAVQPVMLSFPNVAINSVTADGVAQVDGTDYEADAGPGFVWRLCGTTRSVWTAKRVQVVYAAGWILPESGTFDTPADLPAAVTEQCIGLVTAAYASAGRDPAVQRDTQEGVGSVQYFDRLGSGAMQIDEAMREALAPYRLAIT